MYTQTTELIMLYGMAAVFAAAILAMCYVHYVSCRRHERSTPPSRIRFYQYCDYTHRIIAKVGDETICGEVLFDGGSAKLILADDGNYYPADVLSREDLREIETMEEKEKEND